MLRFAHPELTDEQRAQVLQLTALDSGYPLDLSGEHGGWQRMNLQAALSAEVTVDEDGNVVLGSSGAGPGAEAGTETGSDTDTGSEAVPDTETGSEAEPGAAAEREAESGVEPEDEPEIEPEDEGHSEDAEETGTEPVAGAEHPEGEGDRSAAEPSLSSSEVAAGDQGSTPGSLASTGFGMAGIAAVGLVLLVAGGVLIRRSRRQA